MRLLLTSWALSLCAFRGAFFVRFGEARPLRAWHMSRSAALRQRRRIHGGRLSLLESSLASEDRSAGGLHAIPIPRSTGLRPFPQYLREFRITPQSRGQQRVGLHFYWL